MVFKKIEKLHKIYPFPIIARVKSTNACFYDYLGVLLPTENMMSDEVGVRYPITDPPLLDFPLVASIRIRLVHE